MVMPDPKYKGRCIQLITPTTTQAKKYESLAEKAGVPLSKYLLSIIEDALAEKPKPRTSDRALREEVLKLREDNHLLRLLVEKNEKEVREREQSAFLDPSFTGERNISSEITAVLRRSPTHDYQLLDALGIDPQGPLVQAVQKQLATLEMHGYITKNSRGWQWKKS